MSLFNRALSRVCYNTRIGRIDCLALARASAFSVIALCGPLPAERCGVGIEVVAEAREYATRKPEQISSISIMNLQL